MVRFHGATRTETNSYARRLPALEGEDESEFRSATIRGEEKDSFGPGYDNWP
jgi:hypothetical protein